MGRSIRGSGRGMRSRGKVRYGFGVWGFGFRVCVFGKGLELISAAGGCRACQQTAPPYTSRPHMSLSSPPSL